MDDEKLQTLVDFLNIDMDNVEVKNDSEGEYIILTLDEDHKYFIAVHDML